MAQDKAKTRPKWIVPAVVVAVCVIAAAIATGVVLSRKNSQSSPSSSSSSGGSGGNSGGNTPSVNATRQKMYCYYGQNAIGNTVDIIKGFRGRTNPPYMDQKPLAYYCDEGQCDTFMIAFLYKFGGGDNSFGMDLSTFGRYMYDGSGSSAGVTTDYALNGDTIGNFLGIGRNITYCRNKGIKIILSLGGDANSPYFYNTGDGALYANLFYDIFLTPDKGPVRPFGDAVFDGMELDVEQNPNPAVWSVEMVNMLNIWKSKSPDSIYAVVPQCYPYDSKSGFDIMGAVITNPTVKIDYIIVQWYNNPTCSYPFGFNYYDLISKQNFTQPIVLGLAGDPTSAITGGWLPPSSLQAVYDSVKNDKQFFGISLYDISSSNTPFFSNYSSMVRSLLDGNTVAVAGPPQPVPYQNDDRMWSKRCGGTWFWANQSCGSVSCTMVDTSDDPACGGQRCFNFMMNC